MVHWGGVWAGEKVIWICFLNGFINKIRIHWIVFFAQYPPPDEWKKFFEYHLTKMKTGKKPWEF